jgi:hypothetical protein
LPDPNECHGSCGIEQDDIASREIYDSVVLNDCRSARQLSYDEVILHVITANVQLRPVNADSVAREIHRSEPEDAPRAHPACEDVGSASRTKTTKILAQCSYETIIAQFWSAEKIIVWLHHRLHGEMILQA